MSDPRYSRREMIRKAGVAAGALSFPYIVPASALGKDGAVAPSNRITMGCIGVGGQGIAIMRVFMGMPDVQIVSVCDVDADYNHRGRGPAKKIVEEHYAAQKEGKAYKGCDSYDDFRELLARKDIDTVTVCTPDHWHGLIAVAAARAGKDIYCEKPLTNTIAEGRAVCDAVAKYKRVLQNGSHERSNPNCRRACELVRNGRIGKLHTIRINLPMGDGHHEKVLAMCKEPQPTMPVPEGFDYDFWLGPTPKVPYTPNRCHFWWRFIMAYGGGEMTDRGAHVIDIGQLGNGTDDTGPIKLSAKGKRPPKGLFNTFMEFDFDCQYANGVRMIGSNDQPRGLKFEGDKGSIFVHIHGGKLEAEPASLLEETIGENELHLGRTTCHRRNFIDCVRSRETPMAPAEVGHRTATICHLLNIGMTLERPLTWDPAKERIVGDEEANTMLARPMRAPWHL